VKSKELQGYEYCRWQCRYHLEDEEIEETERHAERWRTVMKYKALGGVPIAWKCMALRGAVMMALQYCLPF
jgi:hypothetical protein